MTAADIVKVAVTVSLVQVFIDLYANYMVYEKEPYQKAVRNFEKAAAKFEKLTKDTENKKSGKQQDKVKKRQDVAKDDMGEAKSIVAQMHARPGVFSSILFLVLFQVFNSEYYGKVIAVLPFEPFRLMRKVTLRGLDFGSETGFAIFKESPGVNTVTQACNFTVIYLLINLGVKYYVHKLVQKPPPSGVEGGFMTIAENPRVARSLKAWGLDPDELKQD